MGRVGGGGGEERSWLLWGPAEPHWEQGQDWLRGQVSWAPGLGLRGTGSLVKAPLLESGHPRVRGSLTRKGRLKVNTAQGPRQCARAEGQFPGRPPEGPSQPDRQGQVSSHPALPQASWLRGCSLCACCSQRQLSAHRGPFVLATSSARRADGNRAHSPHPLPRPQPSGRAISRLARRPLAHRASTGNCLPALMLGGGQQGPPPEEGLETWDSACQGPGTNGLQTEVSQPALTSQLGQLRPQQLAWAAVVVGGAVYWLRCPLRMSPEAGLREAVHGAS